MTPGYGLGRVRKGWCDKLFDIWDESNSIVRDEYRKDNYIINEYDNDSNLVAIYFSSNGIYYPNTEEAFREKIIDGNRFEWLHYKIEKVRKEMFFRDIYKSWYVTGINERINSVDKLIEFIKQEIPEGSATVVIGNSAGGYMAALAGTLIGADYVLDFSGQNLLLPQGVNNPYIKKFLRDAKRNQYFDLNRVWEQYAMPKLFYFYSYNNKEDNAQHSAVKNPTNFFAFGFNTDAHERTMYRFNIPTVINMSPDSLTALWNRFSNRKKIGRFEFSVAVCGWIGTAAGILNGILKRSKFYRIFVEHDITDAID